MGILKSSSISEEEKDILQELMNIAFGNASADLAQVIDIYVNLSIPNIQFINVGNMSDYIEHIIGGEGVPSVVDQKFWGDLNGSGLLIFPNKYGKNLISILENEALMSNRAGSNLTEEEILLEVGNILIGACVGKITEMLDTYVTYSPPQVLIGVDSEDTLNQLSNAYDPNQTAIAMKALFTFKGKNVKGFVLIITRQDSLIWLKNAIKEFMKSYE